MYFMFGDTHRLLTPEEVDSIAARTDFLCIEKSHGRKVLGAAELGAKHEVAAFAKIKPASQSAVLLSTRPMRGHLPRTTKPSHERRSTPILN